MIFIGGISQGQKIVSEGLIRLCGSQPRPVPGTNDLYVFQLFLHSSF